MAISQFVLNSNIGLLNEPGFVLNFSESFDESRLLGPRVSGTFYIHNHLATALVALLIILLPTVVIYKIKRGISVNLVIVLLGIVTLILTQSRAALLAMALSLVIFMRYYFKEAVNISKKLLNPRSIAYLSFIAICMAVVIYPRLALTLESSDSLGGGVDYRYKILEEAYTVFLTNPLFGFGAQTNEYLLFKFFPKGSVYTYPHAVHEGHMQFLLEYGLVGSFIIIIPFYIIFRGIVIRAIKNRNFLIDNRNNIFRFFCGILAYNLIFLFQPYEDFSGMQYLGILMGFGLISLGTWKKNTNF
jgi:O-antigen ligase